MTNVRFGIVGTGYIARAIGKSIGRSLLVELGAVASRDVVRARTFIERGGHGATAVAVEGYDSLVSRSDIDAVFIGTPTTTKESIALASLRKGKHVLVDKPFESAESIARLRRVATEKGLLLMDATHFVHHPRHGALKVALENEVGPRHSLQVTFHVPFDDRSNIRFDPQLEPMGIVGDAGWYAARAAVEYLCPWGPLKDLHAVIQRDGTTGAAVRSSGLVEFKSGEVLMFDLSYLSNTAMMALQVAGKNGIVTVDDFALDWGSSIAFCNPRAEVGYRYWHGIGDARRAEFRTIQSERPQHDLMIDSFVRAATKIDSQRQAELAAATMTTQSYVDAMWDAVRRET